MAEYICKEDAIKLIREDKVEITPLLRMITPYYSAEQVFDAINQACERHIEFIRNLPIEDVQPVKWISVTERLPDFEGSLLCMRKTAFGLSGQEVLYYEDGWFSYDGIEPLAGGTVTHWMPLPEPPKDGET